MRAVWPFQCSHLGADKIHRQTGVAPNGAEIHPVLRVRPLVDQVIREQPDLGTSGAVVDHIVQRTPSLVKCRRELRDLADSLLAMT